MANIVDKIEINHEQAIADFNAIENALKDGGVEVPEGTPTSQYGEKIGEITEKCAEKTLEDFWNSYQNGGSRTDYTYAFTLMNSKSFKPMYNLAPTAKGANHMFRQFNNTAGADWNTPFDLATRLEEQEVTLDFSNCTSVQLTFYNVNISRIGECDFSNCEGTDRCFYNSSKLTRIDKVIGGEKTSFYGTNGSSFYKLPNLTYIRFGGTIGGTSNIDISGSPLLEVECFTNSESSGLFDCLADKTGDTSKTWTCTIGTDNLNKLTNEQKAIATQKGWTLA